jgi:hypothetical protein
VSKTYKQSPRQVSCEINDEVVILDLQRSMYFGLQGAGVQIWQSLAKPRSVAELCAAVQGEFDVSAQECRSDVEQVVAGLEREGLVEVVG